MTPYQIVEEALYSLINYTNGTTQQQRAERYGHALEWLKKLKPINEPNHGIVEEE